MRRLLTLCALLVAVALAGCSSFEATENNGPVGDARVKIEPRWPHPFAERSSHRTTTRADGSIEEECGTCEGGTCPAK